MPEVDDVRRVVLGLPGAEERQTTGGAAWFVRGRLFAWECHPWPSIPEPVRAVILAEAVVGAKVGDPDDARALREMDPAVFLPQTTRWGEPKIAFRLGAIDPGHLTELLVEAWRTQAPKYLVREWESAG
ncbi:MmcQ/YjbR family DNA-binding protein [Microbacterium sp. PA5]|uniref:MmcQ/YjbR family DNA-binding protein n=1 Tax=Microbacterium sp. PA5 TaxID=3416654 RepID=UPI003CF8C755